ncbi:MAG: heparinase II/III family protein [Bacteroidales bacterium]|nr:heparinase II/III family protein [Bacteroidales bacterium]
MKRLFLAVLVFLITGLLHAQTEYVTPDTPIPAHPRILLLKGEEKALKKQINADPYWKDIQTDLIQEADRIVDLPVNQRIKIGKRLLSVSRENLRRIFDLCYAYRMTGQKKYALRAEQEMLAAAAFSDWNPSHFLDVGEMTMALAIGYDWLYDKLPPASREAIRTAIIEKGLKASLDEKDAWFLRAEHNWNQVCNGGMLYGALAVYDTDKEFARNIINRSISTIRLAMGQYAPDGAYPEGVGYWSYGTSFNMMFIAALEKAYGTDFGLLDFPGFLQTGMYSQELITPSLHTFNYSDNGAHAGFNPTVFWFYSKTQDPALLYLQKRLYEQDSAKAYVTNRLLAAALIFGAGSGASLADPAEPSERMWTGRGPSPVAVMRSSWSDPEAAFLGFKLGSPAENHAHMDVGSFIFEADGIRWALDLGSQGYEHVESRGVDLWNRAPGSQRWDVFRYRTTSHNTLCFNDKPMSVTARAELDDAGVKDGVMYAMSDLSAMYADQIPSVKRAVSLVDGKYAVIQDLLRCGSHFTKVRWNIASEADQVTILDETSVLLEKNGKRLFLQVDSPVPVRFYHCDATPTNTYDSPNPGVCFVGFEADLTRNEMQQIKVYLMPQTRIDAPKSPFQF